MEAKYCPDCHHYRVNTNFCSKERMTIHTGYQKVLANSCEHYYIDPKVQRYKEKYEASLFRNYQLEKEIVRLKALVK